MRLALGFRPHTGWTVAVALGLAGGRPVIVHRERLELADPELFGAPQPYHGAQRVAAGEAQALVERCVASAFRLAEREVGRLAGELRAEHQLAAAAVVGEALFEDLPAAAVLASHARMHAQEGALFQEALARGCAAAGLPVLRVAERRLPASAAAGLGLEAAALDTLLTELGRSLGPPWQKDHRLAAMAAWLALVSQT
jgi:hypothetical protein